MTDPSRVQEWSIADERHVFTVNDMYRTLQRENPFARPAPPPMDRHGRPFGYHDKDEFVWTPHWGPNPEDSWYDVSTNRPFTVDDIVYDPNSDTTVDTARRMIELREQYTGGRPHFSARQRWDLPAMTDAEYQIWWDRHAASWR